MTKNKSQQIVSTHDIIIFFRIIYTPIDDGPQSFKIFCSIAFLTKFLTLCVNALSFSIKPKVTYNLIGNEHVLNSDYNTNIHLDQVRVCFLSYISSKIVC